MILVFICNFKSHPFANNHLQGYQNVMDVAQMVLPDEILYVYPEGHLEAASPVNI
jgi:hypothetical protein